MRIDEIRLGKKPLSPKLISEWIKRAHQYGFEGFGGWCGVAAVAINEIIFQNRGRFIGAANKFFLKHGRLIGHIAVEFQGHIWDSDGRTKSLDQIESWGMLDPDDSDYVIAAKKIGVIWNEDLAYEVEMLEFDNAQDVLRYFPNTRNQLHEFVEALQKASK